MLKSDYGNCGGVGSSSSSIRSGAGASSIGRSSSSMRRSGSVRRHDLGGSGGSGVGVGRSNSSVGGNKGLNSSSVMSSYKLQQQQACTEEFHKACVSGDFETALVMLKMGVNLNVRFERGQNLLHIACAKNFYGLVQLLIKFGCNEFLRDNLGRTALHYAAMSDSTSVVRYLVEKNRFSLSSSSSSSSSSPLLSPVSSLSSLDSSSTSDSISIDNDDTSATASADAISTDLLTREFLNAQDNDGKSVLHLACEHNNVQILQLLLQHQPQLMDVDMCDTAHRTALAICYERRHLDAFELLLASRCRVDLSVLEAICIKGDLAALHTVLRYNDARDHLVKRVDAAHNTLLYLAIKYSYSLAMVSELLELDVRLNLNDMCHLLKDVVVGLRTTPSASAHEVPQNGTGEEMDSANFAYYLECLVLLLRYSCFHGNQATLAMSPYLNLFQTLSELGLSEVALRVNTLEPVAFKLNMMTIYLETIYKLFAANARELDAFRPRLVYLFALAVYSCDSASQRQNMQQWLRRLSAHGPVRLERIFDESFRSPWSLRMLARLQVRRNTGGQLSQLLHDAQTAKRLQLDDICIKYLNYEFI